MDQGVLAPLKLCCWKHLILYVISECDSTDKTIPNIMKTVTIKDAVYWASQSWEEATLCSLAKNCKKNLLPSMSETTCQDENIEDKDAATEESPRLMMVPLSIRLLNVVQGWWLYLALTRRMVATRCMWSWIPNVVTRWDHRLSDRKELRQWWLQ